MKSMTESCWLDFRFELPLEDLALQRAVDWPGIAVPEFREVKRTV